MENKICIKKRIMYSSIVLLLTFLAFAYGFYSTYADFSIYDGVVYDVYDATLTNLSNVGWSGHNQAFYSNISDRWYILYPVQYATGDYRLYYSYSDSGDFTTWNSGGTFTTQKLVQSLAVTNCPIVSAWGCWEWDETNSLGHCAYYDRDNDDMYYFNFTINEANGQLVKGSEKKLYDFNSSGYKTAIDLDLDSNGYPIISFSNVVVGSEFATYIYICDSIDGYNGNWSLVYWIPHSTSRHQSMTIPMGSGLFLSVSQNLASSNLLKAQAFNVASLSNATTGSTIGDNSAYTFVDSSVYVGAISSNYNSTHGCIAYTDGTNKDVYTMLFDFDTLTFDGDYRVSQDISGNDILSPMVNIHNNEFFVSSLESTITGFTPDLFISEQVNPLYTGLFNVSQNTEIMTNFVDATGSNLKTPICSSRVTDDDGNILYLVENGTYASVVFATLEGEYGYVSTVEIDPLVPYDLIPLIMFLVGALMMVAGPTILVMQKTPESFVYMFMLVSVGLGLVIGWLYWT